MKARRQKTTLCFLMTCLVWSACLAAGSFEKRSVGQVNPMDSDSRPRLTILIIVDQMRADYLVRFESSFRGGIRRMLDEGQVFENAWVDHAYTNSLPGHTTIMTGSYPRRHGITDNQWYENINGRWERRTGFSLVDRSSRERYQLGATTLMEWLSGQDARSRMLALGSNDAPRLYTGLSGAPLFYYSEGDGGFSGDPSIKEALPDWVSQFNQKQLLRNASKKWTPRIPPQVVERLRPDASIFENSGVEVAFPHRNAIDPENFLKGLSLSPFVDESTLELASIGIKERELGADDVPDLLVLSLNSLDEVGHAYGPFSHEQADAVLRLDRFLGEFMERLDQDVGEGEWMLALTADHGVTTEPEQLRLSGSVDGRRVSREEIAQMKTAAIAATANRTGLEAQAAAVAAISRFDFVDQVLTLNEVASAAPAADSVIGLMAASYVAGRVPAHPVYGAGPAIAPLGLFLHLRRGVMVNWATAIHGSAHDEDRRVPLMFYGKGVRAQHRTDRVATVDVAPTIANLMGITVPNEIDGSTIPVRH